MSDRRKQIVNAAFEYSLNEVDTCHRVDFTAGATWADKNTNCEICYDHHKSRIATLEKQLGVAMKELGACYCDSGLTGNFECGHCEALIEIKKLGDGK